MTAPLLFSDGLEFLEVQMEEELLILALQWYDEDDSDEEEYDDFEKQQNEQIDQDYNQQLDKQQIEQVDQQHSEQLDKQQDGQDNQEGDEQLVEQNNQEFDKQESEQNNQEYDELQDEQSDEECSRRLVRKRKIDQIHETNRVSIENTRKKVASLLNITCERQQASLEKDKKNELFMQMYEMRNKLLEDINDFAIMNVDVSTMSPTDCRIDYFKIKQQEVLERIKKHKLEREQLTKDDLPQ